MYWMLIVLYAFDLLIGCLSPITLVFMYICVCVYTHTQTHLKYIYLNVYNSHCYICNSISLYLQNSYYICYLFIHMRQLKGGD